MKKIILCLWLCAACVAAPAVTAHAFWMWTPESGKWVNPKYAVKDTPQEQLEYALEVYQAGEPADAEDEMRKLIKHYPKAREAAEAQFYIAQFQQEQGDLAKAFKSYQLVLEKYPFTERTRQIIERQYNIADRLLQGKAKREEESLWARIGVSYIDVVDMFRQVIKNAPYGEFSAPSQYKIGLYFKEEGLLQEARDAFEKTLNDYPETEWAQAARYQIAASDAERSAAAAYDQKITATAIEELEDFVQDYPEAELKDSAKQQIRELREKEAENNFIIAEFYEKQEEFEAAKVYYHTIVDEYDKTEWASKALEKIRKLNTQ
ncbi:MAG: tetratricopeptide repeat protein [Candidatus Omnitrophota bacterium]